MRHPSPDSKSQAILVEALSNPLHYPHPATPVVKLETHISYIFLAGDYAYKIKKPLNLGFLDFTSLEQRKLYCSEEVRLNRRLAPDLYIDFIPISGSVDQPILGGDPVNALEYAVRMRRFAQHALLDRCLSEGILKPHHMDALARQLAQFHGSIARAGGDTPFGTPEHVQQPVLDNFTQTRALLKDPEDLRKLAELERWSKAIYERLQPLLTSRRAEGFIRECHGDLHLGNMILQDDEITVFDCIEFNEDLRWIDTISDLAFLTMDLHRRGASALAWRLLNGYLEFSGDYAGLQILTYYQVYRAMVRAKIAAIRLNQPDLDAGQQAETQKECRSYLDLALHFSHPLAPFLLITHGVSGSGKTHITAQLLELMSAIRIRSDVERKRLFGLTPLQSSGSALDQGLYTAEVSARTYERLRCLAELILAAGYPVLVDATFLEPQRRQIFRALAAERQIPFVLLAFTATPDVLRERLTRRSARGDNAAEADVTVLEQQLRNYIPPTAEENPLYTSEHDEISSLQQTILRQLQEESPPTQGNA